MYARPARKNSRKALSATAADIAEDTAATEDAVRDTAVVKGTAAESARRRTITS